jgi:hypothetical protein
MAPNIADDFLVQEHIELIFQQAKSIWRNPEVLLRISHPCLPIVEASKQGTVA